MAALGLARKDQLMQNRASPGDILVLAGGATGRDGIHGASFASRSLEKENRSAVQIPDAFLEKLLLEATLEAAEAGILKAVKDLGGGGLSCCLSETSDSLGLGFEVDLEKVRSKEPGMSPEELMISESQERMLFVVEPSSLGKLKEIFEKYELGFSVIGSVASHKDLVVKRDNRILARMPSGLVAHAPLFDWVAKRPRHLDRLAAARKPRAPRDMNRVLLHLLATASIASKKWVYQQFDHEVGIRTVLKPGDSDAAVLRLDNGKLISAKLDGNSKQCYLDPKNGTLGCLSEGYRNTICTGAEPIAIVDHLQFGSPENPEVFWAFTEAVRAIVEFCEFMQLPVAGGKVSLYNETAGGQIKPTPVIGTIGLMEDARLVTRSSLKRGDSIFVIGH
ncbi:MAG TPA: AIR synthase-related protein, partial [Nitrososphaera sp.]|nr:AIR synthase-related protein [Nitrososphaera sp.]